MFLDNPDVAMDTNHVERELRVIPMGRKNWMFYWTELGARQVGMIQSLLVTCKLQGINTYVYLVDVLQRIDRHPAAHPCAAEPLNLFRGSLNLNFSTVLGTGTVNTTCYSFQLLYENFCAHHLLLTNVVNYSDYLLIVSDPNGTYLSFLG